MRYLREKKSEIDIKSYGDGVIFTTLKYENVYISEGLCVCEVSPPVIPGVYNQTCGHVILRTEQFCIVTTGRKNGRERKIRAIRMRGSISCLGTTPPPPTPVFRKPNVKNERIQRCKRTRNVSMRTPAAF